MRKYLLAFAAILLISGCGKKELKYWERVDLAEGLTRSHIMSVICKNNDILVGTYGNGALFSENNGKTWRLFKANDQDDSAGISWNYVTGGDWKGEDIILATAGNGLNVSSDKGATWKKLDYSFFDLEYLYAVKAVLENDTKYFATADGIVYFEDDIDPDAEYKERPYNTLDEQQGLTSQYIYDMVVDRDNIYVGSLRGFSVSTDKGYSWSNFSPDGSLTKDGQAKCKVRAVAVKNKTWYAGCDNGLFYSTDEGLNWVNISRGLLSTYIHDILIDNDNNLWIATYKGVAFTDNLGQSYKVYGKTSGFYGDNINCLAQAGDGNIYAGTNYGLYRMKEKISAVNFYPEAQAVFNKLEKPEHQWMQRPVSSEDNNMLDQTYLYGSKLDGSFRQHQGCEYNNPEGTKIRAVASGTIVYTSKRNGHMVLQCNNSFDYYYIYAHYHHLHEIYRSVGREVSRGDIIGAIGKKGNVTNEHLHFEVSLSEVDDSNIPNRTVNCELWQKPLPGCGTIVGNVVDTAGIPVMGAKIYGVEKPVPTETPFSYAETYRDSVSSSPAYEENFVIGDVPAGDYLLWVEQNGQKYAVKARVGESKITRVKIAVGE